MAFTSDLSAEDGWLKARVADTVDLCERRSCPCFMGFLDERQRRVAEGELRRFPGACHLFWGGHEEAERTLLGVFPDYIEPEGELFPLTPLGFLFREETELTHRDVLGALLSCGIKREKIGDILCGQGIAVAFLDADIAPFVADQVDKIKREGVRCRLPYDGDLPIAHTFLEMRDTVASPRLDAVVKTAIGASREEAARRIVAGLVSLNHTPCLSVSASVKEGDILSVRGVGRFRIDTLGPLTRKGRIMITLQKYC